MKKKLWLSIIAVLLVIGTVAAVSISGGLFQGRISKQSFPLELSFTSDNKLVAKVAGIESRLGEITFKIGNPKRSVSVNEGVLKEIDLSFSTANFCVTNWALYPINKDLDTNYKIAGTLKDKNTVQFSLNSNNIVEENSARTYIIRGDTSNNTNASFQLLLKDVFWINKGTGEKLKKWTGYPEISLINIGSASGLCNIN